MVTVKSKFFIVVLLLNLAALPGLACVQPKPGVPPPSPAPYSVPELKYRLITSFGDLFYVDPDFYPVAREGQEETNALERFPVIRADEAEFSAIRAHLNLADKAEYSDEEKLLIYREHKRLTLGVQMTASEGAYRFVLRTGEGQGERIEGNITRFGEITVTRREPSFNTYPVCLAGGTLIDTPYGRVPVERLRPGMAVWTTDIAGNRIATTIAKTKASPVPPAFQMIRLTLSDGRSVTASPGHPSAEGKALGHYSAGDMMDGARVAKVEYLTYDGAATYDLLPSGTTGTYRANGILLMSTLKTD